MAKEGEAHGEITKYSRLSKPHTIVPGGRCIGAIFGVEQTEVKRIEDRLKEVFTEGIFLQQIIQDPLGWTDSRCLYK